MVFCAMSDIAYKKALTQYLGFVSRRRLGRWRSVGRENQSYYLGFRMFTNSFISFWSYRYFEFKTLNFIENRNKYKTEKILFDGLYTALLLNRFQHHPNNTVACLTDLKTKGYKIVATSLHQNSLPKKI